MEPGLFGKVLESTKLFHLNNCSLLSLFFPQAFFPARRKLDWNSWQDCFLWLALWCCLVSCPTQKVLQCQSRPQWSALYSWPLTMKTGFPGFPPPASGFLQKAPTSSTKLLFWKVILGFLRFLPHVCTTNLRRTEAGRAKSFWRWNIMTFMSPSTPGRPVGRDRGRGCVWDTNGRRVLDGSVWRRRPWDRHTSEAKDGESGIQSGNWRRLDGST